MKIGILTNPLKAGAIPTLYSLRAALRAHGCEAILDLEAAALIGEKGGIQAAEFVAQVDIAAVLGGDGTMLNALLRLGNFPKPVAGINIGTLGFLTSCTDDELDFFAHSLSTENYSISPRTLLVATILCPTRPPQAFVALNEITLTRGETGRLVSLRATVNGELLNDYRADGLIVATPTGSTAYSLSAGGPLISPNAAVFVITPICPHSLSQRSLILEDNSIITLSSEDHDGGPMIFTVDGRDTIRIETGDLVEVKKAPHTFHLLRLQDRSFYQALRQKLGWQGSTTSI